jgi:hypothetical protein
MENSSENCGQESPDVASRVAKSPLPAKFSFEKKMNDRRQMQTLLGVLQNVLDNFKCLLFVKQSVNWSWSGSEYPTLETGLNLSKCLLQCTLVYE